MRFDDLDIGTLKLPTGKRSQTYSSARAKGLTLILRRGTDRRLTREFHLRYTRPDGTGRTSVLLGTWPDIDADKAVELAEAQRALLKRGVDPVAQTRASCARARADQFTAGQPVDARYRLAAVAADWLAEVEEHRRAGTVTKYRQAVTLYLLPELGGTDFAYSTGLPSSARCATSAAAAGPPP